MLTDSQLGSNPVSTPGAVVALGLTIVSFLLILPQIHYFGLFADQSFRKFTFVEQIKF